MKHASRTLPRRYPGLKPFEREQASLFCGRKEDIQYLSDLIHRERLVVMFAKSGIGKTSLLQAGCAPEIEKKYFLPIFLRTDRTDQPLLETIGNTLENAVFSPKPTTPATLTGSAETLWEKLKRLEFDLNGFPAVPALFFDQFEEVFTRSHQSEDRLRFFRELADLANETMPEALRKKLLALYEAGALDINEMQQWEKQPDVRIVLSIRSDFLHLLDRASKSIPGILRNRFELLPLNREKARAAMMEPAREAGEFSSKPFLFSKAAMNEILDFLSGQETAIEESPLPARPDEIETVNLQIICQDVEERIIESQKAAGFVVESPFFDGPEGLRNAIRDFYQNQLELFPKSYIERVNLKKQQGTNPAPNDELLIHKPVNEIREIAQRLIEDSLITSGNRRNSVVDDTLISEYLVSSDFLDTLVDKSRLLRKEPRLDAFYYEISHDTLLPAIIELRHVRRQKEQIAKEKAAYEAKLEEEAKLRAILELDLENTRRKAVEQELFATRRQRKLARTVAMTSFLTLLIVFGFSIWFVNEYVQTTRNQVRSAEYFVYNELFSAASVIYEDLLQSPRKGFVIRSQKPHKDLFAEYQAMQALEGAYLSVKRNMALADSMMLVSDYARVLASYQNALDSLTFYRDMNDRLSDQRSEKRVNNELMLQKTAMLNERMEMVQNLLVRDFKISLREYETYVEAGIWEQARRNLLRLKRLIPASPAHEASLQKSLKLQVSPSVYIARELNKIKNR
ncbi:MAG: hypothetical protein SFV22_11630 [Saprospiraceae bacterium]|nr:hypothetical protein [Saprospiraceae bacterium]